MKRSEASTVAAPVLADGLAEYFAAVRVAPPGLSLEEARLLSDLHADRIACPAPEGMTITTSFATGAGRETPVRIYRPAGEGAQPAIVYFHGGGFTMGSIASFEPVAMALAEAAGASVVSVHYDRLPESTPRALVEQCYAALCWTVRMAEVLRLVSGRTAVAGDSAGACIATLLAILARDRRGPDLACQILAYGAYELDKARAAERAARHPALASPVIEAMIDTYHACDARDPAPFAPPVDQRDLSGLPPALMIEAEHDILLEEGHAYADRLRAAGVMVELHVAAGMPHGFLRAVRFSAPARAEMRRLGEAARMLIGSE